MWGGGEGFHLSGPYSKMRTETIRILLFIADQFSHVIRDIIIID